jgi:hypothetical protein
VVPGDSVACPIVTQQPRAGGVDGAWDQKPPATAAAFRCGDQPRGTAAGCASMPNARNVSDKVRMSTGLLMKAPNGGAGSPEQMMSAVRVAAVRSSAHGPASRRPDNVGCASMLQRLIAVLVASLTKVCGAA